MSATAAIVHERTILGRRVQYMRRSKHAPMGRFGGGWQFSLGIQAARGTVILNLGVATLRIDRKRTAR